MKKNVFLFILLFNYLSIDTEIFAQKKIILSKFAIQMSESANGMSPTVYKAKNLIADDANGYVFQYVTATFEQENRKELTQSYISWGLWKTPKSEIFGNFTVNITNTGDVISTMDGIVGGNINMNFSKYGANEPLELYNQKQVKEAFEATLDKISARGTEGTEIFYADIPRKGTTIGLFIVLGSEIKANKGVPKWKYKFGELVFNKQTEKFTFVKSK